MSHVSAGEVREDDGVDLIPAKLPGKSLEVQLRAKRASTHHKNQQKRFREKK